MRIYEQNKRAYLLIFPLLLFVDQIIKYIVRAKSGFYICNQNLAFGIKALDLIIIFAITLTIFILIKAGFGNSKFKARNPKQRQNSNELNSKPLRIYNFGNLNLFRISNLGFRALSIMLIISGAISNLIDRLHFGCVIDYIDLHFWPVFNMADVYITIGAFAVIMKLMQIRTTDSH